MIITKSAACFDKTEKAACTLHYNRAISSHPNTMNTACPCQSSLPYEQCCAPLHRQPAHAQTAGQLMRSRYAAYATQNIAYIVQTTVPAQQHLLDTASIAAWSEQATWLGLDVLQHIAHIKPHHAQVEFIVHFAENGQTQQHHECSAFVQQNGRWYFIDPTVPLPSFKAACICGSARKFKACCGQFFR
ncbi:YchJ family protein [Kingella kingae]|uniref:YchJ family protein n=1 Tax=Kingella kingae TaxID=504 RepID=UPI000411A8AE|nr:YchJ family protein [Kingella kingae]